MAACATEADAEPVVMGELHQRHWVTLRHLSDIADILIQICNLIERLNSESKYRTERVDIFLNDGALTRQVSVLPLE